MMEEFANRVRPDEIFVLIIVLSSFLFVGGTIVSTVFIFNWRRLREREMTTAVIHNMLDAGLSTDEIERVLQAGGVSRRGRRHARHFQGARHQVAASS